MQQLIDFFGIKDLIPHGYCLSWSPVLLWLHVISDVLITAAYYSIPLTIVYFLRKRKDLPFTWLAGMFAGFIVACGTTHLLSAITVWIPLYWLDGLVKGFTAILSIATAVLMLWLVPRVLSLPSAAQLQAEIRQRQAAEEALRYSEAKFHALFDSASDAIMLVDEHGFFDCNKATLSLFGCATEEEFCSKHPADLSPPMQPCGANSLELANQKIAEAVEQGSARFEWIHKRLDTGELFPAEVLLSSMELNGKPVVQATVRDITERKLAEEASKAASLYARSLIEASLDPLVTISIDGKITDVNVATEQVTGVDREQLIGSDFADYFTEPEQAREGYRQVFLHDFVFDYPLAIRHVSGKVTDVLYNASLYHDVNGNVQGVFAAARDVTERMQADRILNQLKAMIEISMDGFWIVDLLGNILQVNQAYAEISGYSIDELVKMSIGRLEALEAPEQITAHIAQIVDRGYDLFETRHRHKDGRLIDIEVSVAFLPEFQQFCAFCRDITERKQMEAELKASEAKFRSIIEVSPVPMALNDEQSNITYLNPAFVQTFGYTLEDIPRLADWWPKAYPDPDYRNWVETTWQATLDKAKQDHTDFPPLELSIRCKNAGIKTVLATVAAIDRDFTDIHLVMLYDITPRKLVEAELSRSNAELEQFAYAVSHDMRQPLRMVTSYLALLESALAGKLDEETQQFLAFAANGAKRMDAMIQSLLEYSRVGRKVEAKTQVNSKDALDEALAFLDPELRASGGEIKVSGDWPELFANRDELTRLLQNLIGNALKYHQEKQAPLVLVHGAIKSALFRVEVRDHGIGIPPDQIKRLFKVFSRLQPHSRYEGSGVGLALCRKIVEHHGGAIGVQSAGDGQGSVFWFELPLEQALGDTKSAATLSLQQPNSHDPEPGSQHKQS